MSSRPIAVKCLVVATLMAMSSPVTVEKRELDKNNKIIQEN
jgi:hypothetical protein